MGVRQHPIQHKILSCFCHASTLRFADIRKQTNERSNLVTYHLKKLAAQGIILKEGDIYRLAQEAEFFLPYLESAKQLKLPVALIAVVNKNKVALIRREQRPYQHYWSLPGGKIHFDETIGDAAVRISRRELGAAVEVDGICGIVDERVFNEKPKHGWLLFVVRARAIAAVKNCKWCAIKDLDAMRVIESDKWMIRNLLNKNLDVTNVSMQELPEGLKFSVLAHS
jgi:ADP-ribose pyrophosphatase YjhB (NUDIX family)